MIISYTVLEIWNVMDVIVFYFGQFFALLPPLTVQKIKISKKRKKKNTWRYHFKQLYQKL